MMPQDRFVLIAAAIAVAMVTPCRASVIAGATATGPGLGSADLTQPIFNDDPGNDNVDFSDNFWEYDLGFAAAQPIDLVFTVRPPDAGEPDNTTEYDFAAKLVNDTGQTMTGMQLVLGFYSQAGQFIPSVDGDGLDFDFPDLDSFFDMTAFTVDTHTQDVFGGSGTLLPTHSERPAFSVDVPVPTALGVPASAVLPDGSYRFAIRHIPAPEPASAFCLAVGGLAIVRRRATSGGRARRMA